MENLHFLIRSNKEDRCLVGRVVMQPPVKRQPYGFGGANPSQGTVLRGI